MKLFAIKSITEKNIDRIINENLYRGHIHAGRLKVQCMDKDTYIIFNFIDEVAVVEDDNYRKTVPINSIAPKLMASKIIKATC